MAGRRTVALLLAAGAAARLRHASLARDPAAPSAGVQAAALVSAGQDYARFVHDVIEALRSRPLDKASLSYFLFGLANPELAKSGEWAEFGVGSGDALGLIAKTRYDLGGKRQVHGFDNFRGLPEKWDKGGYWGTVAMYQGDLGGKAPYNDTKVTWHIGEYNDTVTAFTNDQESQHVGPLTFVHIHAGPYALTSDILRAVEPRLGPGVFMVIDELINYPNYEDGEMKALYEFLLRTERQVEVIGYDGGGINESPQELHRISFTAEPLPESALLRIL